MDKQPVISIRAKRTVKQLAIVAFAALSAAPVAFSVRRERGRGSSEGGGEERLLILTINTVYYIVNATN